MTNVDRVLVAYLRESGRGAPDLDVSFWALCALDILEGRYPYRG